MQIISLAWGEAYTSRAFALLCNARSFSIPMTLVEVSGEPSKPQDAKRLKPGLLKGFLRTGPICWIDADAKIHKFPKLLLSNMAADIGLYQAQVGKYWNGTMMLNPTEKTFKILDLWEQELAKDGWQYDQEVLGAILKSENPTIFELPYTYSWMSETHKILGQPIIEHYGIGLAQKYS